MSYRTYKESLRDKTPHNIKYSIYQGPQGVPINNNISQLKEKYNSYPTDSTDPIEMKWVTKTNLKTTDPYVWGSAFWFTLHNGADKYPIEPNQIYKERMKNFILGIPFMLPCENCKVHAIPYIENKKSELDTIVSSRENLVKFFVDFHNQVNERYSKKIMSYDDVNKLYNKGVNLSYMKYN